MEYEVEYIHASATRAIEGFEQAENTLKDVTTIAQDVSEILLKFVESSPNATQGCAARFCLWVALLCVRSHVIMSLCMSTPHNM
jgi:hypothetical protein